jgi:hypothetical protein
MPNGDLIPGEGEVLPAIKVWRIGSWSLPLTTKVRVGIALGGLFGLCVPGGWLLSLFLQMRGVESLMVSRLLLGGLWLVGFLMCFLVLSQLVKNQWTRWIVSTVVPLIIVVGLDWWAPKPTRASSTSVPSQAEPLFDDAQLEKLNLSPEEREKIDRTKAHLFQLKSKILELPTYRQLTAIEDQIRNLIESNEVKSGCLIDISSWKCFPKPPTNLADSGMVNVDVSFAYIENDQVSFWVIHPPGWKLKVPIVLYVSLRNLTKDPIKISLVYLEAKNVGGWSDIRMADTWYGHSESDTKNKPLIFEAKTGNVSLRGDYLIPSLYDRVIQPGDSVEGWIIAEYPKGFKYVSSIGEMRISLAASKHWVASKIFTANPPVIGHHLEGYKDSDLYFRPLDTMLTEEP